MVTPRQGHVTFLTQYDLLTPNLFYFYFSSIITQGRWPGRLLSSGRGFKLYFSTVLCTCGPGDLHGLERGL